MIPFIQPYQFHFIKKQTQVLTNGHLTVNDPDVIRALESLAEEKVMALFEGLTDEQRRLLTPIVDIKAKDDAEAFLETIKQYVIPFPEITDKAIAKLFPKAKKRKVPTMDEVDLKETTYLGWVDKQSGKKLIITQHEGKLVGLEGTFSGIVNKGICMLCGGHEEVGLFMVKTKRSGIDNFTNMGNYMCKDSEACNRNLTDLEKLHEFIERVNR